MVETNPQDNDMGIGIITNWDPFCTKDNVWQENIGRFKLNDPFYSVIKEDGTTAYIPQGKTLINSNKNSYFEKKNILPLSYQNKSLDQTSLQQ